MTRMWWFGARVAAAASYVTLAVADPTTAADIAIPYAALVFLVFVGDLWTLKRKA